MCYTTNNNEKEGRVRVNKFEDLLNAMKLGELMNKKNDKKHCTLVMILAIIGSVMVIGAIAYAVYKHFSPDYLEDFDDEYEDDDFDDEDIEFSSDDDEEDEE